MKTTIHSWSKENKTALIGIKKVDWSIFTMGTPIPIELHEDFRKANQGKHLSKGEKHHVTLVVGDTSYDARLVNIDRKQGQSDSLQIRYDSNNAFKQLVLDSFKYTYNFINDFRKKNDNKTVILPDEEAEYIEFYRTDQPFVYKVKLKPRTYNGLSVQEINYWWVNQGQTFKQEKEGGFLWAPQKSKQGRPLPHHFNLVNVRPGDIVFCYSAKELKSVGIVQEEAIEAPKPSEISSHEWQEEGYLLKLDYYDFVPPVEKEEIPAEWRLKEGGPFDVNGNLKQGYFFTLSKEFSQKLFSLFKDRFPVEVKSILSDYVNTPEKIEVKEKKPVYLSVKELVNHIDRYIKSKGFYYEKDEVINLFLSLKTKPFLIISGISGTGKTKIVQWFAESVGATEKNGQFSIIPIRPDWNDGSDLLGYVDIKGEFKEGPLTKVIKNAHQNPELPYFVLLDEMNLARVEYYFSDILSVMESRKWENGEVVSSTLLSSDVYGEDVTLPNNLYIIGTVNMDETTHPFSKKVLDRANTIEFNRVNLGNLAFLTELEEVEPKVIGQDRFASKYLHLKDVYKEKKEIVAKATDELVRINESLQLINAHVGYRVRDEICFYLVYNEESNLMKFENAFDHCILQKILPRIAGSDTRVEQMLRGLFSHFTNRDYEEDQNGQIDIQNARYPRSAAKVAEMLGRLRNDGFTSFWIS